MAGVRLLAGVVLLSLLLGRLCVTMEDERARVVPETSNAVGGAVWRGDGWELTFRSSVHFPVTGSMPELTVGSHTFRAGWPTMDGLGMVFLLSDQEFQSLDRAAPVSVRVGRDNYWRFHSLSSSGS